MKQYKTLNQTELKDVVGAGWAAGRYFKGLG